MAFLTEAISAQQHALFSPHVTDHLDLVLTNGYLGALLGNARVVRYLAQHQREILVEFQRLTEVESAAA